MNDIYSDFSETLLVQTTSSYFVSGKSVKATSGQHYINAVIQPVTGLDLQALPEGDHNRKAITIYCDDVITTSNEVVYSGDTYQVIAIQEWKQLIGHYKIICVKKI